MWAVIHMYRLYVVYPLYILVFPKWLLRYPCLAALPLYEVTVTTVIRPWLLKERSSAPLGKSSNRWTGGRLGGLFGPEEKGSKVTVSRAPSLPHLVIEVTVTNKQMLSYYFIRIFLISRIFTYKLLLSFIFSIS